MTIAIISEITETEDADTGGEIAVFTALTEPSKLTEAQALTLLESRYKGIVVDCSTTAGYASARKSKGELTNIVRRGDEKRLELNRVQMIPINERNATFKKIESAALLYRKPFDTAIKAEDDRKAEIKAEKDRVAAAAQAKLDGMIVTIGKLPLQFINMDSGEISRNLAVLEAKTFGAEFTGDTLARAEATKAEAVQTIREMLAATVKAEEIAAALKAEQEAESARLEAERVERDRLAEIENKRLADERAVNDEQKRLNDIESARLAELAKVEQKRLDDERAIFEKEKAEVAKKQVEDDRIANEKQAAIDAENKRVQDEADAKQREIDRQAAIVAETARKKAEVERKAAEKALKLERAKCFDEHEAFKKILGICQTTDEPETALEEIATICEAMLL